MTMWAVAAVELVHPAIQSMLEEDPSMWAECERCPRAFASVWSANLTFFQTIVAGDSWGLIAVPVAEAYPLSVIILMGALITMIFGVLNLIVAVIVDTFAENRQRDVATIAEEMDLEVVLTKRALSNIFSMLVTDRENGMITFAALQEGAENIEELKNWLKVMDVDTDDLKQLFDMVDHSSAGEIDSREFVEALYRLRHTEQRTATRLMKHNVGQISEKLQDLDSKLRDISTTQHRISESTSASQHGPQSSVPASSATD